MSITNCYKRMRNGVMDAEYLENRLNILEARIDDLCGLLGELIERLDREEEARPRIKNALGQGRFF